MTEPLARIEAALSRLGAEHEPPAGWEARVLAATVERRRKPWWVFSIPVAVMAAGAIVLLCIPPKRDLIAATMVRNPTGSIYRASSANDQVIPATTGEFLKAEATGGKKYRALWIYLDRKLETRCPLNPLCVMNDENKIASVEFEMKRIGKYEVLAVTSDSPIAEPIGEYQIDLYNVQKANATVKHGKTVDAR